MRSNSWTDNHQATNNQEWRTNHCRENSPTASKWPAQIIIIINESSWSHTAMVMMITWNEWMELNCVSVVVTVLRHFRQHDTGGYRSDRWTERIKKSNQIKTHMNIHNHHSCLSVLRTSDIENLGEKKKEGRARKIKFNIKLRHENKGKSNGDASPFTAIFVPSLDSPPPDRWGASRGHESRTPPSVRHVLVLH